MVLIVGFGHTPAPVELAGRRATSSAEPGCEQGSAALEQRRGVGGAPSCQLVSHCDFRLYGVGEVGFGQSGTAAKSLDKF